MKLERFTSTDENGLVTHSVYMSGEVTCLNCNQRVKGSIHIEQLQDGNFTIKRAEGFTLSKKSTPDNHLAICMYCSFVEQSGQEVQEAETARFCKEQSEVKEEAKLDIPKRSAYEEMFCNEVENLTEKYYNHLGDENASKES